MQKLRAGFDKNKRIYESALLTFKGVDGFDVYNCSVPFKYKGKTHIYGRVEKRAEWANSHVRLFVETGKDEFTALPDLRWELEDPYVQVIHNEFIFGGTHVMKNCGKVRSYFGYFYRGPPTNPVYFTTGPDYMKDIRTVQLADGHVGVFSRKRTDEEVYVGFCTVNSINELSMEVIAAAQPIDLLREGEWGGVNQPYLLTSGKVGCVGHYAYKDNSPDGIELSVYVNIAFVFDPTSKAITELKVIGTKGCYPSCTEKLPYLRDCAFTTGIIMREDGKCDLYSGLGDTHEGRITIDYPFEGHGRIVNSVDCTSHI